jgi:hypothetical protein
MFSSSSAMALSDFILDVRFKEHIKIQEATVWGVQGPQGEAQARIMKRHVEVSTTNNPQLIL